jgi:adenylate kinase family enzyme
MEEVAEELSAMASQEDDIGRVARDAIAAGRVSDEVCNLVLRRVLSRDDLADGYLLLGYPKDAAQAEVLYTTMPKPAGPSTWC